MKIAFYFLFVGVLFLFTLNSTIDDFKNIKKQQESAQYLALSAKVNHASVLLENRGYRWHSVNKKWGKPSISYTYTYKGEVYKNSTYRYHLRPVSFHLSPLENLDDVLEYRALLNEAETAARTKPFKVFVNPKNPAESVVDNSPVRILDVVYDIFPLIAVSLLFILLTIMRKNFD